MSRALPRADPPTAAPPFAGAACAALSLTMALAAAAGGPAWRALFVAASLAQGAVVLVAWRRGQITARRVLAIAVLLRLAVLWLPPSLSDDAWRYVWDGLVQTHGVGPFAYRPDDAALAFLRGGGLDAQLYARLNSAAYFSVYPPLSQAIFLLAAAAVRLGASPLVGVYAVKAVFAAAEVGGLILLSRMVSPRSLLLYAWHPLVVIESAGQPHGESLMAALLLACVWLARQPPTTRRRTLAGAALGGAVMVKLYPIVLLPLLWRRLGAAAMVGAGVVLIALALPYGSLDAAAHVRASLALYVGLFEFNALPYFLLRDVANWLDGSPRDLGKLYVGKALQLLFLAALPLVFWLDRKRRWPLDRAFAVVLGLYLVCSTTVHPWYLLGVLAMPATLGGDGEESRPQWHWLWFALLTSGTYLRYAAAGWSEAAYLGFVYLAWGGWLALLLWQILPSALQAILRHRGRSKARRAARHLPAGGRLLDLGAGEGYVGRALAEALGAEVILADVAALRRVGLAAVRYDGRRLPFAAASFDGVVLYFVLHHARRPRLVLGEALRVCKAGGRVVVVESVYRRPWERRLLDVLDRGANRLRGGGQMAAQEPFLHFRRAAAWRRLAESLGGRVVALEEHGRPPHRQATLVVEK